MATIINSNFPQNRDVIPNNCSINYFDLGLKYFKNESLFLIMNLHYLKLFAIEKKSFPQYLSIFSHGRSLWFHVSPRWFYDLHKLVVCTNFYTIRWCMRLKLQKCFHCFFTRKSLIIVSINFALPISNIAMRTETQN